ncbi:MAG TPA: RagB/SusD family nutrient uptake outer membrane protein, partial [Prevotella sp.]
DMFGHVPLVVSEDVSIKDVKQNRRSEVFRFAFEELQAVAPLLPNEHSNREGAFYGRITRPVAWFLLAKLALNAEVFADDDWTDGHHLDGRTLYFEVAGQRLNAWKTVEYYADLIASAGYTLADGYADNFAVHNENSVENILTIPMDKTLYANQYQYLFRSRHYNHGGAIGMDAENGTCATLSTLKTYGYGTAHEDTRYRQNFYSDTLRVDGKKVLLDNGQPLVYMPLEVKLDLSGSKYEKTAGARMAKYEIDRTAYADGKLQDNDIVLFRYADVLLMVAEAKVRNGGNGDKELNQVRARAGMPERVATLDAILEERLLELMWEGTRRQDLVRYGLFCRAYDQRTPIEGEDSGFTTVFPIPDTARDLNANLKQNPGYKQ